MPDELMSQLEQAAEKLRRSKGWIINDALKEYLTREQRKTKMLEETYEALADIKAGRVTDGNEILDWLDTWGTESEKPLHK
jgi:predicted transcriptional regulator